MLRPAVCFLVAAAAGTASAQHARFARPQPDPDPVELTEEVRPIVVEASAQAAPLTPAALDLDSVLSMRSLRKPVLVSQAPILEQLIANTPDSDVEEKGDYYLRLGELYAQQHRVYRKQPDQKSQQEAKLYLLKTVKAFKGLADNPAFLKFPRLDEALFVYGHTLLSGKYAKEARAVFDKLVKNFPSSPLVAEANVAIAEYMLASGIFADAKTRYEAALAAPRSNVTELARYRLGWIQLSMGHTKEALDAFGKVVVATRNNAQQAGVYAAALGDLARTHGKVGTPERALDAFRTFDAASATELAVVLAEATREQGAPDRTAAAYKLLLARAPADARACKWQYARSHAMLSVAGTSAAEKTKQIEALVQLATKSGTDEECRQLAAAMSSQIAGTFHLEWSKTKAPEPLALAERLYAAHLKVFPTDSHELAARAEILWTRADREPNAKLRAPHWRHAAAAFAAMEGQEPARITMLAWMNALDLSPAVAPKAVVAKPSGAAPRSLPLPTDATKLVAAFAAYLTHEPAADAELATMRLALATMFRRYRHFDEAVDVLDVFLEHHQDDPRAELAAQLLLDSLSQARRADDLEAVADAIAKDGPFVSGKPALQKTLEGLRQHSR
jgi:tetratricopeptide (TPR) repeat protein